jgi:hypothetical protein
VTDRGSLARALASESWDVDSEQRWRQRVDEPPAARIESDERRLRQLFEVDGSWCDAYVDEAALTRIRAAIDEGDLPV